MNKRQFNAVSALIDALKKCAEADLTGGVYDMAFCVWPSNAPNPHDSQERGKDFFTDGVEGTSRGIVINNTKHGMSLDGGAGN